MSLARRYLEKTSLYGPARKLYRKLMRRPRHPLQDMRNVTLPNLLFLGTDYGGWAFIDEGNLEGSTIISAGLGEDASFDVEFAKKYRAKVVIVDPTPRAIQYFEQISARIGRTNLRGYNAGGAQPAEAYDLSDLGNESLVLVDKALWNKNTKLRFFEPTNPRHVSHSIVNYQQGYSDSTSSIEVEAVTLSYLLAELNLDPNSIPLIKLDIEGAEIEVLSQCLVQGIKPNQILVEFDELNVPSRRGFDRVTRTHDLLNLHGYKMVRTDGATNFLYVRT
jgi:FkbM family methyltransferase